MAIKWNRGSVGRIAAGLGACLIMVSVAAADDNVSLVLENSDGNRLAAYSKLELEQKFPFRTIETATPWSSDGSKRGFRGPAVGDVITELNLTGRKRLEVTAQDGFVSELMLADIKDYEPILATEISCTDSERVERLCEQDQAYRPMTINDRGPFYVIWPREKLPESYVPARNGMWIWYVMSLRPGE